MRRFGNVCAVMLGMMGAMCPVCAAEDGPSKHKQHSRRRRIGVGQRDSKWRVRNDGTAGGWGLQDGRERAHEELERVGYEEQGRLKATAAEAKSRRRFGRRRGRRVEEMTEQIAIDPPPISLAVENATLGRGCEGVDGVATGATVESWQHYRWG